MKKAFFAAFVIALTSLTLLTGCTDKNAVADQNQDIQDHNWTYLNKFSCDVNVADENLAYNVYMNLRVTDKYKYSNIFVLVTQTGPDKKPQVKRYELTLADKDGAWLGKGSGNLYSYQTLLHANYKFPAKGVYHFYIEQNMRDNPLREVSDVGLRVEKAL